MPDRRTETLIEAIRKTIIKPFGIPKFLRSNNEPGLWTSNEFFEFLQPLGTKFFPTSVGSPWGNGHAERSIRTIKEGAQKFLMQEKLIDQRATNFSQTPTISQHPFMDSPRKSSCLQSKYRKHQISYSVGQTLSHTQNTSKKSSHMQKKYEKELNNVQTTRKTKTERTRTNLASPKHSNSDKLWLIANYNWPQARTCR
jgi:hypothetical protein